MAKYSYHRLDANHVEIRDGLIAAGATVHPKGPLDYVVGFRGANYLIEVKTEKGKLRPSQERFFRDWRGQKALVRTLVEALRVIGAVSAFGG